MDFLLQGYSVSHATWFYLSLLLIIAVYFRFGRFWSLRNLDLCLLLSVAPGMLFTMQTDDRIRMLGYGWLFAVSGVFLFRLFADPLLRRRPQFEQNLNSAGLAFLCVSGFAFLMTNAITKQVSESTQSTIREAEILVSGDHDEPNLADPVPAAGDNADTEVASDIEVTAIAQVEDPSHAGEASPTGTLIATSVRFFEPKIAARILAIFAHTAVIIALLLAGRNLFGDIQQGLAMATLYLLLPSTAYQVGEFNHVLPAAFISWAIICHRHPYRSGILMGLACGSMFFPIFLIPLWCVYYGRRDFLKFLAALLLVASVLVASLALTSADPESFFSKTVGTIDPFLVAFQGAGETQGFWQADLVRSSYRIAVIAAYLVMVIGLTLWPRPKTLENLLAQSAAIIVGTQMWYTQEGGVYLLWHLPLMLMVMFRPRLMQVIPSEQERTVTRAPGTETSSVIRQSFIGTRRSG